MFPDKHLLYARHYVKYYRGTERNKVIADLVYFLAIENNFLQGAASISEEKNKNQKTAFFDSLEKD